ncbi:ef hand family protein [Stylonychia lemnae]|uniref:Ef hand family protein n=1 Tax=Stylonychia lemnae TaxID=5949 RepID=A0A078A391_STYLE|nr:ef hand family protein [Stylonychia lemnae]|eukprot:CDW76743.1 ef hand family protein [Stylonychia lemnae]
MQRGAQTIRSLGKVFKSLDSYDGNRKVDAGEFFVGLQEVGVKLSRQESDGKMNARRQAMVDKAFLKFDKNGDGHIDASDLKGTYNCSFHPKVTSGQMTEDQVFLEFLSNFNDRNRDGKIHRDEWNDYYHAVSASIDNDDHFVQLMKAAWKLD